MPAIYVEVGKMNTSKAPKEYAAKAEAAMKDAVTSAVKGDKALTDKKGEGYTVRLSVADLKVDGGKVSCKLSGELVRAPKPEMVSTSISASANAQGGKPESLVVDCVGAAAESMMKKIIPVMKAQAR
ncbi:MAG TPA: hypothetical protein VHB27_05635 [Rhodopila sp.]|uniref:hypothetical protein n=1 Tax=Rhodopila sp. TaxID=2480087 RepID=UPI002C534E93|nr:hypothetical protein [Rhodopila sp.]HVY14687.1 hypothetical protein [Rhodopila sp.]